ncbi:type IV toxin-antitoxin system AbiEi family antitoxin domain-containing protein [Mumia zhuanghuii]|uniref:Type IV toxin-antitoxin system AbiEi family antitoxin domain-containing protein n=2 Tax=Mumia TaxID=1546255 RepID=A0ABW1QNF1_9ACTN|nr:MULTISPECIES: type IV toxin-antitoxin system AbiEi family antitoxin domain-containing protein [Mumia]KAA1422187.1 type IV toxin-antitoxin system AbiEi family antitoxin domain-containing protein [Mumia zhuanghuii]
MDDVAELLATQSGVVARRQILALGLGPNDVRRMLRRDELVSLHPGVLVNHTGDPTWIQRAWGAVLYAWPAALAGESALRAARRHGLDSTREEVVTVAVDRGRNLKAAPDTIDVVRRARLHGLVLWNTSPPRLRYEEAVLDLALDASDEVDAVAVLAGACGSRRTTALRLVSTIAARSRVARRRWLIAVLRDIAEGTHSVLEHGYLDRVVRPHCLPRGRRQLVTKVGGRTAYRDVEHGLVVVELDGRIYHESSGQRDDDLERDLDVLVEGRPTARLGWGQVYRRPCATALKLAMLLRRHGWGGSPVPCSAPDCAVRSMSVTC